MKYRHLLSVVLMLMTAISTVMGQTNTITIPDVTVAKGKTISLPVNMDNTADVVAVQFTLTLPDGLSLNTASATLTERAESHAVTFKSIGTNRYMAMIFSAKNTAVKGRTGKLLSVSLTASDELEEGSAHALTLSDVTIGARDGSNLTTGFNAGKVIIATSPDLVVSQVETTATTVMPGSKLSLSWNVSNIGGLPTTAGWNEQIYLKDNQGASKLLGTAYYDETLAAEGVVSRNAEVNLPAALGVDGDCKLVVKLTPNSNAGEPTWLQDNNTAELGHTLTVQKMLMLSPETIVVEEATDRAARFQLIRSGNAVSTETFTLSYDADSRITLPESVTIESGNSSVYFYAQIAPNQLLDDGSTVSLSLTGNGYPEAAATIQIEDDTYPDLGILTDEENVTEGGNINFIVSTQRASQSDIEIKMTSDHGQRFRIPASIVIPAGHKSVEVIVEAIEDDVPNVEEYVNFTVSAAKHNPATVRTVLQDNDVPTLQLEITPTAVSEAAGPLAITARLTRTDNIDKVVTVKFSDDANGGIYYGRETITLEKGVREATLNLGPVDNAVVEGERTYHISAAVWIAACSCNATNGTSGGVVSVPLTVYDNDGPTLTLTSVSSMLNEGGEMTITITRNTNTANALVVSLECDHDASLEYPATVTIPAGEASASFTVKSKGNDTMGDGFTAMLNAKAEGFATGNILFAVSDQTLPDAQITGLTVSAEEVEAGGTLTVQVTVANTGSFVLPEQTKVGIYISNTSSAVATLYLQNALPAGESVVLSRDITLPSTIGQYNVYAIVNDGNEVNELSTLNNGSAMISVRTVSPFSVSLQSDKSVYLPSEKAQITGRITGADVASKEVEVYVINDNYRHTMTTTTLADGSFAVEYEPYSGQMGNFVAGACYPGEGQRTEMLAFDYYGIKRISYSAITCEVLLGETYTGQFDVMNPGNLPLTNVKVEVVSKPENCEITANCPSSVNADALFSVSYSIDANAVSEGNDWQHIELVISSAEGVSLPVTLYCYCRNKQGKLATDIVRINTTMIKGASRDYPFSITNVGKGETGKITLELPAWMSSATPREMASLKNGESATVILRFTPTEDMQLNVPQYGQIGLNCSNGEGMALPFYIEPVSETTGTLIIDVCDEYTYYTEEKPHLAGANVIVSHPTTGVTLATGTTGEDGTFRTVLPEGYYTVNVTAPNHNSYRNNLLVDPGVETIKTVNLSIEAIRVDWQVEETTVEDEYSIVTTVNFETNVPVPVVELSLPQSIDAKSLPVGESLMFYAALTNKGLITAEDVVVELPTGFNALEFEALSHTTPFSLAPQQSILIPVKVTHVDRSNSSARVKPIDDDPCVGEVGTLYYWDCGLDRKWHRYGIAMQLGSCNSNDPSTWGYGDSTPGYSGPNYVGPGGISGGGGYYISSSGNTNVSINEDKGCEPCQNREVMKWVECGLSFIPIYGCVKGSADCGKEAFDGVTGWRHNTSCALTGIGCAMDLCAATTLSTIVGAPVAGACEIIGYITNTISCLIPFTEPCDREAPQSSSQRRANRISKEPDYLAEFRECAEIPLHEMSAWSDILTEIFGDPVWVSNTTMGELYILLSDLYYSSETTLTASRYLSLKPESISITEFETFIERLNNTDIIESGDYIESTNYIDKDKLLPLYNIIQDCENISQSMGYKSTDDMWLSEAAKCKKRLDEGQSSVCASITLQFSQKMVMTRQAFRGTLTVFNGNESTAMTDMTLTLEVKDEDGNVATSHEFQINPETLNGFEGALSLDGGWTLNPQETGVATILFIPTKFAAPTVEKLYSFGGSLSYVDPFTGLTVTRDLAPVTLTVKPSPDLDLTYFLQRDVKGDDPLTEEIEPSEEAEFSLLINNIGYGDATDVRMYTNQPEIIDNEKGLQIDFELISSQLNGGEKNLALGGTVATEFGTIPAHSTTYAQWWLRSSLLGHFTSYNVEATHVTSYGNPDLTLLHDVTIHELIRSLDVEVGGKKLVGFMTNDIIDVDDLPDMLYLSNGEIEPVAIVQNAEIRKISDTEYALTLAADASGWTYGSITDPTYGLSELQSVVRQSDGKQMPLRNFWQTDRTLRDGRDALYENRIHFADYLTSASETYILTVEQAPELVLEVAAFENVPVEGIIANIPVSNVNVVFNKYIDPSTFTTDDITLVVQGAKQDVSTVSITTEDNKTFSLDLTSVNGAAGNGYYVLTVNTPEITDIDGYQGKYLNKASWVMFRDGLVCLHTSTYPAAAGTVKNLSAATEAEGLNATQFVDYGSTVKLSAVANEGYVFSNWTINGEVVSTESEFDYALIEDLDVKANYTLKSYAVTISNDEGGVITGSATGVYSYGEELILTATADEDYTFEGWIVNEQLCDQSETLTIVVDGTKEVNACFKQNIFEQPLTVQRGWNWVSSYVNEPVSVNSFLVSVTRIVSQFDETINDPEFGLIGGIETLQPGQAYKMEAEYSIHRSFKGQLHDLVIKPIELHTGWNWISYPYVEGYNINDVLTNASEGDYLTSQEGFAEFANGNWEGTLTVMTPGYGYIYKSATDKVLTFDFAHADQAGARGARAIDVDAYVSTIDIHKYPSTMNVIAHISGLPAATRDDQYRIYAFAGNECRGESRYVGENHYITIYGDNATDITFVIENETSGNTYQANEHLTFASEVVGSRNMPYPITIFETMGIHDVNGDRRFTIISYDGMLLDSEATIETLHSLNRGIYIIDGQKYMVK